MEMQVLSVGHLLVTLVVIEHGPSHRFGVVFFFLHALFFLFLCLFVLLQTCIYRFTTL